MQRIDNRYKIETKPLANQEAIVQGDHYRFTVLTSKLIRMEYQEDNLFEDRATKSVTNRDFVTPKFRVVDQPDKLEIYTEFLHLEYNKKPFSSNGLQISIRGNLTAYNNTWHYGDVIHDLGGTTRTLDLIDGSVPLEHGLLSQKGFTVLDDSKSILITEDGWVDARKKDTIDIYFFGYGREYLECLKDFFHLCGSTPMVPRYSLGNWWSRFHRYTEEEYRLLVEKFEDENIPISVAILDMDWHLTEVDPKYGSGWTGYTWNNDFFPDPEHFMKWIHSKGMHISLNVHPADGVRPHEQMYLEMAKELNIDYLKEETIQFDITSPDFMQAYFKYLHHHNEDMGVDFWWVDWQQGASSKIEGLDPLWMLNHYHYLDCKRRGNQLMILSRYAGIGSHRYPIGFSGDTIATWDSLDFQPYFTANASNVGYCWWSHDIGGHMHGVKNDEMLTRWMQFGVFSPIMRIHSSDSPFFEKEPWNHNLNLQTVMKNFLRLRHQLVPYLYTMNWKLFAQSEPLLQPMYYRNTEDREAYEVPNEYYFGSEMIVCPITKPMNQVINLACFKAWLPKGIFFDLFNGRVYRGDRKIDLYRDITSIPVLAKAGSIIPMTGEEKLSNSLDNPEHLEIRIYAGADGEFELYEDNSENATEDEIHEVITLIQFTWSNKAEIHISSSENKYDVIPEKRDYTLLLVGFSDTEEFSVSGSEHYQKSYAADTHTLKILLKNVSLEEDITVCVNTNNCSIPENCILEQCLHVLKKTQISYDVLDMIHSIIKKEVGALQMLGELQTLNLEADLLGALTEIITAY